MLLNCMGLLIISKCTFSLSSRFKDHASSSSSDTDSEGEAHDQLHRCKTLKPVVCMGCQPGSDVFVIGETLQFRSNGEIIPPDEQEYVYIPLILEKLGLSKMICPIAALPSVQHPLHTVMEDIHQVAGDNEICALFCLGKRT